jgi:hypothetical protein
MVNYEPVYDKKLHIKYYTYHYYYINFMLTGYWQNCNNNMLCVFGVISVQQYISGGGLSDVGSGGPSSNRGTSTINTRPRRN